MSGIVGIVHLDGAPIDPGLLRNLTNFLSFRGPDAQEIWFDESAGLGHAMLRIAGDGSIEKQPAHLENRLWIVADARIDARTDLIAALKGKRGSADSISLSTSDAELILHAYDTWGEECVEHLLGDFSFAIWDARKKKLFGARDQFGVKPFFYAQIGPCIIFSNTMDCIRKHPKVSNRLNELAIADFLLFEMNMDPTITSFSDICRLPPAHVLACGQDKLTVRRYWELSVTKPILFRRDAEYIERFLELLDEAVADRLRADSVGVLMSGGLDSTTLAASAKRVLACNQKRADLYAFTDVYERLIPDDERHYATLVAESLKIPIEFVASDRWKIFENAVQPEFYTPEPTHTAWPGTTGDELRQVAVRSRVALTGLGGDPALCGRISVHFRQLMKAKQFGRALEDAARFLTVEGRFSRLYLRTRWRTLFASKKLRQSYPPWLTENFEKRLSLRDRWESLTHPIAALEAVRPEAQNGMADFMWPNLFEAYDAGLSGVSVDVRHPIFDLRLVNFLLALPRLPWCSDKELLREAARGILPDSVRLRRKSPLIVDPFIALLNRPESAWIDDFEPLPELERYVVRNRIPPRLRGDSWAAWVNMRPLSLNFWLHGLG